MLLPSQNWIILALAVLGMFCLGSWVNFFRLENNWRFEIFYFDFAIGIVIMSIVLGLTFGNLGFDGFTFFDDILHAGRREEFYALSGGVMLNLGTMLLMAAVSISGLSLAFPTSMGLATGIALTVHYIVAPEGNPVLLFTGIGIIVIAVVVIISAFTSHLHHQMLLTMKNGKSSGVRKEVSYKAVILSLLAGVSIGIAFPLLQLASFRDVGNELGLGPYSLGFFVAVATFFSAIIFNLVLMNVPVEGNAVELLEYFRESGRRHILGILAGLIWCGGMIAVFTASIGQATTKMSSTAVFSILQGSMILAAIWGLLLWHEYHDASGRVKTFVWVALVLMVIGLTLVSTGSPIPVHEVI